MPISWGHLHSHPDASTKSPEQLAEARGNRRNTGLRSSVSDGGAAQNTEQFGDLPLAASRSRDSHPPSKLTGVGGAWVRIGLGRILLRVIFPGVPPTASGGNGDVGTRSILGLQILRTAPGNGLGSSLLSCWRLRTGLLAPGNHSTRRRGAGAGNAARPRGARPRRLRKCAGSQRRGREWLSAPAHSCSWRRAPGPDARMPELKGPPRTMPMPRPTHNGRKLVSASCSRSV